MKILMAVMLLSISSLAIAGGLAREVYSPAELQEYKERVIAERKQSEIMQGESEQREKEQLERERERNNSQSLSTGSSSRRYGQVLH